MGAVVLTLWWQKTPYQREIVGGLVVLGGLVLLVRGLVTGAIWTYLAMRAGAKLSTHSQQAQVEQFRLMREEMRAGWQLPQTTPGLQSSIDSERMPWLPPLEEFGEIVEGE